MALQTGGRGCMPPARRRLGGGGAELGAESGWTVANAELAEWTAADCCGAVGLRLRTCVCDRYSTSQILERVI